MLFETPFQLRRKYEHLLNTLNKHKLEEDQIIKNNEEKLEEYVKKEIELNEIIRHKEGILKNQYLTSKDQVAMAKTKEAHSKIQNFCEDIQNKFANIIVQRETILIQVGVTRNTTRRFAKSARFTSGTSS